MSQKNLFSDPQFLILAQLLMFVLVKNTQVLFRNYILYLDFLPDSENLNTLVEQVTEDSYHLVRMKDTLEKKYFLYCEEILMCLISVRTQQSLQNTLLRHSSVVPE